MSQRNTADAIERIGFGLALIAAPLLLVVGFAIHPKDGDTGAATIQIISAHETRWDVAHVLVMFGAAFMIPAVIGIHRKLDHGQSILGLTGAALCTVGAVFFASLIAAEGLVNGALASLPANQQSAAAVGSQAILDSKGALPVVNVSFIMLLGLIILGIGLLRDATMPKWVGICVIVGTVVLVPVVNEQVVAVGAAILLIGFGYLGLEYLRNPETQRTSSSSEEHSARPARA